jgi:hypothetical protein
LWLFVLCVWVYVIRRDTRIEILGGVAPGVVAPGVVTPDPVAADVAVCLWYRNPRR